MVRGDKETTSVRRFVGEVADELSFLCRPPGDLGDPRSRAGAIYRDLAVQLESQRASFADVVSETIYFRDIRRDWTAVLDARARVLAELGQSSSAPQPFFIQQAPLDPDVQVEVSAIAIVPRQPEFRSVQDIPLAPSCQCPGCLRSSARLVGLGDQRTLYSSNLYGTGPDAYGEAVAMFEAAKDLLGKCGMEFRDVVRTWIYLRDIDRDYDALNQARREFFGRCGVEIRPASTGVQGIPLPDVHNFAMSLCAVKSSRPLLVSSMSSPTLNEAWSYGADFSRGVRVAEANKVTIHVSGTASIDDMGRTIHLGDFESQVERTLANIAALLGPLGATFADIASGVFYLIDAGQLPILRKICRDRGFEGFPCALVEAPLCRRDLLCEAEAVVMLPLAPTTG